MTLELNKIKLNEYPVQTHEKIRYADMDRQGHVNNALFSTFIETGRIEILRDQKLNHLISQSEFVIAHLSMHFIEEIEWPGTVEIGTAILSLGNSSLKLIQSIYQNNRLKATAESVIVQVDVLSKKSKPLSSDLKNELSTYMFHK